MRLEPLPAVASWEHRDARVGFEVAFFEEQTSGVRLRGRTTANEASSLWSVGYDVIVDKSWATRTVTATNSTGAGDGHVTLSRSAGLEWTVDGERRSNLDGCVDIDFESSAVTNTLPLHRLDFARGEGVDVPAAFVRADDLRVERLEQRYTLLSAASDGLIFHYESSTFDFECELRFDRAGLVVGYPGIAVRNS